MCGSASAHSANQGCALGSILCSHPSSPLEQTISRKTAQNGQSLTFILENMMQCLNNFGWHPCGHKIYYYKNVSQSHIKPVIFENFLKLGALAKIHDFTARKWNWWTHSSLESFIICHIACQQQAQIILRGSLFLLQHGLTHLARPPKASCQSTRRDY